MSAEEQSRFPPQATAPIDRQKALRCTLFTDASSLGHHKNTAVSPTGLGQSSMNIYILVIRWRNVYFNDWQVKQLTSRTSSTAEVMMVSRRGMRLGVSLEFSTERITRARWTCLSWGSRLYKYRFSWIHAKQGSGESNDCARPLATRLKVLLSENQLKITICRFKY